MKFINWILKALKWLKESIEVVKWVLISITLISSLGWLKTCSDKNDEIKDVTTILTSRIEQFKTESGLNATEATNWQLKHNSLSGLYKETKSDNNQLIERNNRFEQELFEAKEVIEDLKIREKDVQNYIKNELVTRDSLETNIIWFDDPCKFKLEPIEQEFLSLRFEQNENYDLMGIDYESRNTVHTLLNLYPSRIDNPKRRRHGKKHFPNWSLFWGYDHTTISTVKDPKSEITNIVSIDFSK